MSVRILLDIEEAISREVRRITTFQDRTLDLTVLKETYNPITGESMSLPIEANFFDSSADARQIQYPHFFVKLLKMNEDLTSGRVIPQYGNEIVTGITTSSKAFEQIIYSVDGSISAPGNTITTGIFKIRKILPGYLIRVLSGNNQGTYKILAVTPSNIGNHTITVSPDLVENLSEAGFLSNTRQLSFMESVDLSTIKIGDIFTDNSSNSWNITAINTNTSTITVDGVGIPDLDAGGIISRSGNIFQSTDLSLNTFSIMDPSKPLTASNGCQIYTSTTSVSPSIPMNFFYLVRIDSKERASHIQIANRMWEEFNPPRTALPTIVRSRLSSDQLLTVDVSSGGSSTIQVKDNSNISVGDTVFVFDELTPTKEITGKGFQDIFTAQVISKSGSTSLTLSKVVSDSFTVENGTRIVSNASYQLLMFHFVDHVTKDVEGAQYWSHEFTFWIQAFIDRQGTPIQQDGVIQKIEISGDDIDGNVIFEC